MARSYRNISADSHLEVGPDRWRDRVPAQYRDRAPRLIRLPSGGDAILAENRPLFKLWAHNAGIPWEKWGHDNPNRYEDAVGGGTPAERLRELDADGIDAEVLFPGVSGLEFLSGIIDDDAHCAVLAAYNEFIAEEYMGAAPERFIPVGVLPKRGVNAAIAEMEHCAQLGLKAVTLSAYPNGSLALKAEDDRFWAAALDIDMPVTVHTMFSGMRDGPQRARGLDLARRISTYGTKAAPIAAALAIHGVFDEQADLIWERHRFYHERAQGLKPLERKPSAIIKKHCLWGFMDNPVGVQLRHHIGVDKIMWSTDFPHDPSDWPNTKATIERNFAGVQEDEKHLMLAGNAIRFFKLNATLPPMNDAERRA
jgi:predicted TIM-barrel fold metal-dependent hydrolase